MEHGCRPSPLLAPAFPPTPPPVCFAPHNYCTGSDRRTSNLLSVTAAGQVVKKRLALSRGKGSESGLGSWLKSGIRVKVWNGVRVRFQEGGGGGKRKHNPSVELLTAQVSTAPMGMMKSERRRETSVEQPFVNIKARCCLGNKHRSMSRAIEPWAKTHRKT